MTSQAHTAATLPSAPMAGDVSTAQALLGPVKATIRRCIPVCFYTLVVYLIYLGWVSRSDSYLTAESGLGYALGIIGGTMMLLLLLYPLRKKLRFMRHLGPVRHWFRMHMVFGVLGPLLVLYHSHFQLGSLNSSVALICMVVVALSGLIGRYIYTKIHYGLYGRCATLTQLKGDTRDSKAELLVMTGFAPYLLGRVEAFERVTLEPPRGLTHSLERLVTLGLRLRWTRYALFQTLGREIGREAQRANWRPQMQRRLHRSIRRHISLHLATVQKIAELSFYERLFSLWHVLHFPLFLMMILSGTIHVIAVHLY
jgi:hypothetical protein